MATPFKSIRMREEKKTEQRAADAILQKPLTVEIGKRTYNVPRPTLATIIEVSAMVAEYKEVEFSMTPQDVVAETLRIAKDFKGMERILAMIVLGAQAARKEFKLFGRTLWRSKRLDRLATEIRDTMTPKEITEMLIKLFGTMDCAFFLVAITSLNRVNHLKATKETTASGQP